MDPFSNIAWLLAGSGWVPNQGGEMLHRPLQEAIPVFSVEWVWRISTDSGRFFSLPLGHVSFGKPEMALQNDARTQVAASISSMTGQTDGVICVVSRNHFWLRKAVQPIGQIFEIRHIAWNLSSDSSICDRMLILVDVCFRKQNKTQLYQLIHQSQAVTFIVLDTV